MALSSEISYLFKPLLGSIKFTGRQNMSILPHITYKSYLLRLSRDAADARWQATLINVIGSHEVQHFVDLERLVTYLLDELDAPSAESGANPCDTFPNNL